MVNAMYAILSGLGKIILVLTVVLLAVAFLLMIIGWFMGDERPENNTPFGAKYPEDLDRAAFNIVSKWGYWGEGDPIEVLSGISPGSTREKIKERLAQATKLLDAVNSCSFTTRDGRDAGPLQIESTLRKAAPGLSREAYEAACGLVQYRLCK